MPQRRVVTYVQPDPDLPVYLTVQDVASAAGIGSKGVHYHVDEGHLQPAARTNAGALLFTSEEAARFAATRARLEREGHNWGWWRRRHQGEQLALPILTGRS